jgi:hypothetical protein
MNPTHEAVVLLHQAIDIIKAADKRPDEIERQGFRCGNIKFIVVEYMEQHPEKEELYRHRFEVNEVFPSKKKHKFPLEGYGYYTPWYGVTDHPDGISRIYRTVLGVIEQGMQLVQNPSLIRYAPTKLSYPFFDEEFNDYALEVVRDDSVLEEYTL